MIKGLVTRATSPFKWLVDGVKFKSHLLQTTDSVLQTIKQKVPNGSPTCDPYELGTTLSTVRAPTSHEPLNSHQMSGSSRYGTFQAFFFCFVDAFGDFFDFMGQPHISRRAFAVIGFGIHVDAAVFP